MAKGKLRCGYTTGTCAAIAAKAAVKMLLEKNDVIREQIITPNKTKVSVEIFDIDYSDTFVSCAVKKDAGDDPDVTNGIMIYAKAEFIDFDSEKEMQDIKIVIDGGIGVGRVTKLGLSQAIGEAAINPVPKKMIYDEVKNVIEEYNSKYSQAINGIKITIYVPKGEEIAKKTFNPRLGIVGGISILGTSGIVEPMSEKALLESIEVEMKVVKASGVKNLIITPGNYGEDFIKNTMNFDLSNSVKCSNFVGDTIDLAVDMGFESILLVGHMGKLVKLAAGIMNTHSHQADGRMEIFTAHSALYNAPVEVLKSLMDCITTDETVNIIKDYDFYDDVRKSIMKRIDYHIKQRVRNEVLIGAVLFSNKWGLFGKTDMADERVTAQWEEYFKEKGFYVARTNARSGKGVKGTQAIVMDACKEKLERDRKRGIKNRPIRAMIAGIPNVGKSTFINSLVGKACTKTGNKPGVTKGKQWIKLNKNIELLDTPGILWPKFEDQQVGLRLALIGSIRDEILNQDEMAIELIEYLKNHYQGILADRYQVDENEDKVKILEQIALNRNCKMKGNELDYEKASKIVLEEFRNGKLGKISLETPEEGTKEA